MLGSGQTIFLTSKFLVSKKHRPISCRLMFCRLRLHIYLFFVVSFNFIGNESVFDSSITLAMSKGSAIGY